MKEIKTVSPHAKVRIGIDNGHSMSKILYYLTESNLLKHAISSPEHVSLPYKSSSSLPSNPGMGLPEDRAWIRFAKKGDCHLIGKLAKSYRTAIDFNSPKIHALIPKITAIVGAICTKENLGKKGSSSEALSLTLDLIVLTPWEEYPKTNEGLKELEKGIKKALQSFYFQSQKFEIEVGSFQLLPEAGGLALLDQLLDEDYQRKIRYYFMVGDKTSTGMCFENGIIVPTLTMTSPIAFNDLSEKFLNKVPWLDKASLISAISTKIKKSKTLAEEETFTTETTINWELLIRESNPKKAARIKQKLEQNFEIALDEFWRVLSQRVTAKLPLPSHHNIDSVIRCGGTTDLLTAQIENYFKNATVTPPKGIGRLVKALGLEYNRFLTEQFFRQNLPLRFADIWGAMLVLAELFEIYFPPNATKPPLSKA